MSDSSDNQRAGGAAADPAWERETIRELVFAALKEQRRARRWSVFFRLAFLGYFVVLLVMVISSGGDGLTESADRHTALVELNGVIASETEASASNVILGLRDAFDHKKTAGVILRINSPGGSPVQAGRIYDEIGRLRAQHPDIPLYAVIEDLCASGGYYVAAAGDRIYANQASIVGSIGVLMNGFGFVDAMDKLGIERRLLTAGENKGFLDPFSPLSQTERQHAERLLVEIHEQFIEAVRKGRGDRLANDQNLFSGLVWTGEESRSLGLVDDLGDAGYVARDVIGAEQLVDFTRREDYFRRLARGLGAAFGAAVRGTLGNGLSWH